MTTTTLYDEVVSLIASAEGIDDTARTGLISEIKREGLTPAMQERIMALFHAEAERLGREADQAEALMTEVIRVKTTADSDTEPASTSLVAEFALAAEAIADELEDACATESRGVDTAVGNALKKRDDDAADAIRQSLKL